MSPKHQEVICGDQHKGKTDPLHSELSDSQQTGNAVECLKLLAAGDILARLRQKKNICKSRRGRCCAQQDEIGGDALGGASLDDADVLREVADEHSYDDKAASVSLRDPKRTIRHT